MNLKSTWRIIGGIICVVFLGWVVVRCNGTNASAYDAGSERNDETCASIPGPDFVECGGPGTGGQPVGGEEGYVHAKNPFWSIFRP